MDLVKLYSLTKVNILGNGNQDKCMEQANSNGKMGHAIMGIICLGKGMVLANLCLITEGIIMEDGLKGNKMGKEHCLLKMDKF